ncbi:hypothetical protein [Halarsenatibacter silvermanii]|uniref:ParB-like nuclease domain-containing protein n=1 Tax=Halarsenatibacter silvermanii TaxID=321763 RepID=A0A1G9SBF6_9FIRM|nr:hypothetical protein [Halarsenatibacter silvermanii]SDM32711.1 hypothetical protein SAMN04488692_12728 [Halarsenatibacter silvermanii]
MLNSKIYKKIKNKDINDIFKYINNKFKRSYFSKMHIRGYTDATVDKILWVNPDDIVFETNSSIYYSSLNKRGVIFSGKWDLNLNKFTERIPYRSLKKHFVDGIIWEQTEYYKLRVRGEYGTLKRKEKIDQYFFLIDKLYENIQKKGYKLSKNVASETKESWLSSPGEIKINLGRYGGLIWHFEGQHRLSIAKILGLKRVPVKVLARHKKWQDIRDNIKYASNLSRKKKLRKYLEHPDLLDLYKFI